MSTGEQVLVVVALALLVGALVVGLICWWG